MIVSVHIPKTAGTSLGRALQDRFEDRFLEDYGDRPLADEPEDEVRRVASKREVVAFGDDLISRYDVVHGHFIADKYVTLPDTPVFCVILRDPAERAASHYRQWRDLPNPANSMVRRLMHEGLDLAAFCALPRMAKIYRLFLGTIPLERFDIVGLTEAYEDTLKLFEAVTGVGLAERVDNVTGHRPRIGPEERAALELAQPDNVAFYDAGRRRFEDLCRQYGVV